MAEPDMTGGFQPSSLSLVDSEDTDTTPLPVPPAPAPICLPELYLTRQCLPILVQSSYTFDPRQHRKPQVTVPIRPEIKVPCELEASLGYRARLCLK